jgi:cytochrome c oxidase cbb3-type subunit 3
MLGASGSAPDGWLRVLVLALAGLACNGAGEEIREWSPADHDNTKGPAALQTSGTARPGHEGESLIAVAWQQSCARCHGPRGRGDGPEGPVLRVPDLTRPEWQDGTSDELISVVIRKGRNKMPAHDLPPKVIEGLVKHVRSLRRP